MIRVVVLDFDGTLVDSNEIKRYAYFHIAAGYVGGEDVMADVLATVPGCRYEVLPVFVRRMTHAGVQIETEEVIAAFNDHVDAAVAAAPEMPGASVLLTDLQSRGVQLHLSSGTPRENLIGIVRRRGWIDMFEGIHGSPMAKVDTLRELCRCEGLNIDEIAVVGDGIDDEEAAKKVGCLFLPAGFGSYHSTRPDAARLALDQIGERLLASHAPSFDEMS